MTEGDIKTEILFLLDKYEDCLQHTYGDDFSRGCPITVEMLYSYLNKNEMRSYREMAIKRLEKLK